MAKKIILTIELNEEQLDALQAVLEKLIATLEQAKGSQEDLSDQADDDEHYWR